MYSELSQFTIRLDSELIKKINYIANFNSRTTPKEIEQLMKRHIDEFQKQHGKITLKSE